MSSLDFSKNIKKFVAVEILKISNILMDRMVKFYFLVNLLKKETMNYWKLPISINKYQQLKYSKINKNSKAMNA